MAYTHLQTWVTNYVRGMPSQDGDLQGVISVYYEQDIPNNKTKIRIDHKVRAYLNLDAVGQSIYLDPIESKYRVNNGSYGGTYQSVMRPHEWFTQDGFELRLISSTYHTVTHNSDGTCKLYVQGSIRGWMQINSRFGGYVYDGSFEEASAFSKDLPTIPRYATINSYNLTTASMTSLNVSWSANVTCDQVQYRIGSGSWVTAQTGDRTSGSFSITGLNPGTQYSITIRVRRKDSQLYTESSTKSATTTDIARITSVADNIIMGNNITVNYSNPSGSPLSISIYKTDGMTAIAPYRACSGTSYTFILTEAEKNNMYNSIPTTNDTRYRIYIRTEADKNYLHYAERKFILTDANPIFNNFAYKDTNTKTTGLTGNNQIIIKDYSNLMATISTTDKAIAQKGATMKTYQLVVGSKQISANYSDIDDVNLSLNSINNNVFSVYAIDSRGNSTLKQISPSTYIDYFKPVITNAYTERTNDIGEETTLYLDGSFLNIDFGSEQNNITIAYKYKKTSDEEYIDGTTTITPIINENNFSFEGKIAGDKEALGFDSNYSYDIVITVADKLDKAEFSFILGSGKPNLAIHRDGVAINQPYDENLGGALQVNGDLQVGGDIKIDGENIKEKILSGLKKEKVNTSLSLDAGDTYQIPDFPDVGKILFMEIFLQSSGNSSKGSANFIIPDSGFNYLVASSNLTGTYKGVYVNVSNTGLITVASYRHGGVNVKGYRIIYLDI